MELKMVEDDTAPLLAKKPKMLTYDLEDIDDEKLRLEHKGALTDLCSLFQRLDVSTSSSDNDAVCHSMPLHKVPLATLSV